MSINTMTVTGNVGANAELRYTQQGTAIGDFNLPLIIILCSLITNCALYYR